MLLLADSGATKTDWRLGKKKILTSGLNPNHLSEKQIRNVVGKAFPKKLIVQVSEVRFYGAGCATQANVSYMKRILGTVFNEAKISVYSDLEAVGAGLLGKEKGIACILGTGSNAGVYNGNRIVKTLPSPGYLVGDEGGGTWIGRLLLRGYFSGTMPSKLSAAFEKEFKTGHDKIVHELYKVSHPARFMAGFARFAHKHRKNRYVRAIIMKSLESFVSEMLLPLKPSRRLPVAICGGIAKNFKSELLQVLKKEGFKDIRIEEGPFLLRNTKGGERTKR